MLKRIERELGRVAGPRFGPRAIDLDILMWEGGAWTDDAVRVPHPRLAERRFAMVPVLDLDPEITMPDGTRLREVAAALEADDQDVEATVLELAVARR